MRSLCRCAGAVLVCAWGLGLWAPERARALERTDTPEAAAGLDRRAEPVLQRGDPQLLFFPRAAAWPTKKDPGTGYFFMRASPESSDFSWFGYDERGGWDLGAVGSVLYGDPYVAIDAHIAGPIPDWERVPYALDLLAYHARLGTPDAAPVPEAREPSSARLLATGDVPGGFEQVPPPRAGQQVPDSAAARPTLQRRPSARLPARSPPGSPAPDSGPPLPGRRASPPSSAAPRTAPPATRGTPPSVPREVPAPTSAPSPPASSGTSRSGGARTAPEPSPARGGARAVPAPAPRQPAVRPSPPPREPAGRSSPPPASRGSEPAVRAPSPRPEVRPEPPEPN